MNVPLLLVLGYFAYSNHSAYAGCQQQLGILMDRMAKHTQADEDQGILTMKSLQESFDRFVEIRDDALGIFERDVSIMIWFPIGSLYLFVAGYWVVAGFRGTRQPIEGPS